MTEPYLIWSNEHRAWWRAQSAGYAERVVEAGRYDREHALRICADANRYQRDGEPPNELPIRESDALSAVFTERTQITAVGAVIGEGIPVLRDGSLLHDYNAYNVTLAPEFVAFVNAAAEAQNLLPPIPMVTPLDATFNTARMTESGLELCRGAYRVFVRYCDMLEFAGRIETDETDAGSSMIRKLNEAFGDEHYEPTEEGTANDPLPRAGLSDARKQAIASYLAKKDNP